MYYFLTNNLWLPRCKYRFVELVLHVNLKKEVRQNILTGRDGVVVEARFYSMQVCVCTAWNAKT